MLILFLVLSWVPMTMHCQLEALTGLTILQCESGSMSASNPEQHCSDCDCSTVETGRFQMSQNEIFLFPDLFVVANPAVETDCEHTLPPEVRLGILTAAPPDTPLPWHFLVRAATPVRAPSFIS